MQRVEYPEFSVEIFMLDTNAMDSHPKNLGTTPKPKPYTLLDAGVSGLGM